MLNLRTRGAVSIVALGLILPLIAVAGGSTAAEASVTIETAIDITASGTLSVQRGTGAQPDKPCPAGNRPSAKAEPHLPADVPEGLVGVGLDAPHAPGQCRYEQAAVLALPAITLPDGAVATSATLHLNVDALASPIEVQVVSTSAEVPTDPRMSQASLPLAGSVPTTASVTSVGPVAIDALPAVETLLAGESTALLVRGIGERALITGHGGADAPVLALTYEEEDEPVEDLVPPTVSIVSPSAGESLFGEVEVGVDAADDQAVAGVTITIGGQLVASGDAPPYVFSVDTTDILDGEHPLVAEARDVGGNTAREVIPVIVDNSGGPLHRLDLDFESGRIDADTYLDQGLRVVLGIDGVTERYDGAQPGEATIWTWRALQYLPEASAETQQQVNTWITPVGLDPDFDEASSDAPADEPVAALLLEADLAEPTSSPVAASTLAADGVTVGRSQCGFDGRYLVDTYDCGVKVGAVTIFWDSGDFSAVEKGTLPDTIAASAKGFADAQDHMIGDLGWALPGKVSAVVGGAGFDGRAISLPNSTILLNATEGTIAATSAHELMHQFQYEYLDPADTAPLPIHFRNRLAEIGWLMEATAEWGAHQTMASRPEHYTANDRETYYRNVEKFLNDPTAALMHWTSSSGRQYGAFPVIEWVAAQRGVDGVRTLWEELDRTGSVPRAFGATLPSFESRLPDMWRDLYFLDLDGPGIDQAETTLWRSELVSTLGAAPYESAGASRPVSRSERLRSGDSALVDVALDGGAAELIEIDVVDEQAVQVSVSLVSSEGSLASRILPLEAYDLDPLTSPALCAAPIDGTFIFDPAECDGVSVVVANTSMVDGADGQLLVEVGDRVDTTISNGTVRLGVNREGHLNASGFEASSGTGTTTVGLRYVPTNADALSPGCECEGWGIADVERDLGGHANESQGGTSGLRLQSAGFDETSGASTVSAGSGAFTVTHEFRPSATTDNLYEVRVSVTNSTTWHALATGGYYGTLSPTYRRVMDWDVEPTAFSEYVTIGAKNGALPAEVITTTNDGFASADPRSVATDLGARGLFTDFGPADHGALFDIALPDLDPGESYTFSMFYGAAANSAVAEAALRSVGADAWSLAEPDVADGAELGQPNTFMFAVRFPGPAIPAFVAPDLTRTAPAPEPITHETARNDGVPRQ